MNKDKKLLNYELFKTFQLEREIKNNINNSIAKKKILHKLNLIEENTNEEIKKINKNITKKEKEDILKYLKTNSKIIKLSAEEIFMEINAKKIIIKSSDKLKEKNIAKVKIKKIEKMSQISRIRVSMIFFYVQKIA